MPMPVNRPRQLLEFAELLRQAGTVPVASAVVSGSVEQAVADRLTLMALRLPEQVKFQATSVLGERAEKYLSQVDRVARHFFSHSLANGCNDWVSVFDSASIMTLNALEDLIDLHLGLKSPESDAMDDLKTTVEDVISQIKESEDLDDETRAYLLEIALHLLQVLQRFELFGIEGIIDLQGSFLSTLINFHPDLLWEEQTETPRAKRRLTKVLWEATEKAVVITGLPANAFAIATVAQLALERGSR